MPSGGQKLVLLHLTDLHFGAPESAGHYWNSEATELRLAEHNRRGLLGSLLRDLRKERFEPDLVIVTGDLLDRGSDAGVPLAIAFLRALAEGLGLPVTRVVITPGNHDVLRAGEPEGRYALYDAIRSGLYGDARPPFPPGTPPHRRVDHFEHDDLGVEVVSFNSCEELEPSAKQEHGSVGVGQRDYAEEVLRATEGRGLFRVAAMHHHLESPVGVVRGDYSVMDDAGAVRRWLAHRRFHLALHGHQHVDWDDVREIDGWFLSITAAGSAGVAHYGRKDWHLPIGYQIIVIDGPTSGRRMRREYDPQTMEWVAAGRGEAVQTLRFGPAEEAEAEAAIERPRSAPPAAQKTRFAVHLEHVERAIQSQRASFRVHLACLGVAMLIATAIALYLSLAPDFQELPSWVPPAVGFALLLAGSVSLPRQFASYKETVDKLRFLQDGYQRCMAQPDDELLRLLDERFHRLI
ncbi:metallophosphoesterase family protein [Polyangium aurulentum]|uniref:metallophosphoesterase family protein n=1 Tax=Polyangium aurulentum TaxID=2567896 RepID=UPI0010AECA6A|nr:metallophosphoesterase [Polyangium aurulentum]UQA62996.1 metallophosphoesterase [Polyangium aurulentum]